MITEKQHYEILKRLYKHSKFEGRNGEEWGDNYSKLIAVNHYEQMKNNGNDLISQFETNSGLITKIFHTGDVEEIKSWVDVHPIDGPQYSI